MEPPDEGKDSSFPTTGVPAGERLAPVLTRRRRPSKVTIMVILVLVVVGSLFAGPQVWLTLHTPLLSLITFDPPSDWNLLSDNYLHLITVGTDGNVWFLPESGHWIGRLTSRGAFSRTPLLDSQQDGHSVGWIQFQRGADGMLWAGGIGKNDLWRIDPRTGTSSNYPYEFEDMTIAHDGSLWYFNSFMLGNNVEHVNLRTKVLQTYPVDPKIGSLMCCAHGITETADGTIWFAVAPTPSLDGTGPGKTGIIRLDPRTGAMTFFSLEPMGFNGFVGLTPAADRGVWLEGSISPFIRILIHLSRTGVMTRYEAPNQGDVLLFTLAPNGDPWMIYKESHAWLTSPYVLARGEPGGTVIPMGRIAGAEPRAMTFGPNHHLWIATGERIEYVDLPG
ncbi:MAG: hypothetical protein H0U76_22565 [Ktedonobacteraceae bacterium]|nr:hypothetical protein [Ktedonobacteraceae bacterium]